MVHSDLLVLLADCIATKAAAAISAGSISIVRHSGAIVDNTAACTGQLIGRTCSCLAWRPLRGVGQQARAAAHWLSIMLLEPRGALLGPHVAWCI